MKQEKIIMGMTIKIEIADSTATPEIFTKIFSYFESVDKRFSTYKKDSEISKINAGVIKKENYSIDMRQVFELGEKTKQETDGYFDMRTPEGSIDTSGIVKGWAIKKAADLLKEAGFHNFYIDAGGDIQTSGNNTDGMPWKVGIRNPLNFSEIIKVLSLDDKGVATSGTYVRGEHIYNPKDKKGEKVNDILSLTVVGPDIFEADRFATAAFAMGRDGIFFIESKPGLEGYMIDKNGIATMSTGFEKFTTV